MGLVVCYGIVFELSFSKSPDEPERLGLLKKRALCKFLPIFVPSFEGPWSVELLFFHYTNLEYPLSLDLLIPMHSLEG